MRKRETLSERLRHQLEEDIISGALRPGERLDEQALARRFNVSRMPVREALHSLSSSGLIVKKPRKGCIVATMTIAELIEKFEVMAELEGMCARLTTRRMTDEEKAELKAVHAACGKLVREGNLDAYYKMNEKFHSHIYAGTHNVFLEDTTQSLRSRLTAYRRYQLRSAGRIAESFAEHDAVISAILNGDADAANLLMRGHVSIQGDIFSDFISSITNFHTTG